MLDPAAVETQTFSRAFRGYRRSEVEAFLLEVAGELRRLSGELQAAREGPSPAEVMAALNEARQAAERIRAEAEAHAAETLAQAQAAADGIRAAAQRDADGLRQSARDDADARLGAAQEKVTRLEERAAALREEIRHLEERRAAAARDLGSLDAVLEAVAAVGSQADQLRQVARQAQARLAETRQEVPAPSLAVVRN